MRILVERMTVELPDLDSQAAKGGSNIHAVNNGYSIQTQDNYYRSKRIAEKISNMKYVEGMW
jgi:hypothetical protein